MRKLIVVMAVLVLIPTATWAGVTINYSGSDGTVQINTQTPTYSDNFSVQGGDFSGLHALTPGSLSREVSFSDEGNIYAATYPNSFDVMCGVIVEGESGYMGQNVEVNSYFDTDYLAQGSENYRINSYVGDNNFGIEVTLNGEENGGVYGDFLAETETLEADIEAGADGSGAFEIYSFAPCLNFEAGMEIDECEVDVGMEGYRAWLDLYGEFDDYLDAEAVISELKN